MADETLPGMVAIAAPSSLYTGFTQLLDDDKTLVKEELLDLPESVQRVVLYHNGDHVHCRIPKQVHLMIENKLMSRIIESGRLEVGHVAVDNQALRSLGKHVRPDAFLFWNASVQNSKFTINLHLVDSRDNKLLWLKGYLKQTTLE